MHEKRNDSTTGSFFPTPTGLQRALTTFSQAIFGGKLHIGHCLHNPGHTLTVIRDEMYCLRELDQHVNTHTR